MKGPHLSALTVEGFRSIADRHSLQLDAPVVLIHGLNGAGKTSLLSAIEYGLTGAIPSLESVEKGYRKQLAHYGLDGLVAIETDGLGLSASPPIPVSSAGPRVKGILGAEVSTFFSQRCYLPQTTLGQLLTIYGTDEGGLGSPLSQFAADLLGLDRLDALQVGLRPARDVRNLRQIAPNMRSLDERRNLSDRTLKSSKTALDEARKRLAQIEAALNDCLASVEMLPGTKLEELAQEAVDAKLADLSDTERQIGSAERASTRLREWRSVNEEAAVAAANTARAQATVWRQEYGSGFAEIMTNARSYIGDMPSALNPEIETTIKTLINAVEGQTKRAKEIVETAKKNARRSDEIDDLLTRHKDTLAGIDRRIDTIARTAPDLATALAAILPHVHGDDCPVCQRDFTEEGRGSLVVNLEKRISDLQQGAVQLAEDSRARSILVNMIAELEREKSVLTAARISDEEMQRSDKLAADLSKLSLEAQAMLPIARAGAGLLQAEIRTAAVVEGRIESDAAAEILRNDLTSLETGLGMTIAMADASPDDRVKELRDLLNDRRHQLTIRSLAFANARKLIDARTAQSQVVTQAQQQFDAATASAKAVSEAVQKTQIIRDVARRVEDAAAEARAKVISEVFNERLNRLWRDLFVRLAPDEPFVPRFDVPSDTKGRLRPILRTVHRSGAEGGSPSVMLSSGNLNTAALTLFLALHLAAPAKLPWLILDDPVQAMDDVHVANFASLLRTLAKEHDRQIIIAVHNRALFDYLSLEMTPAFPGDELITIEFERSASDALRVKHRRHPFRPRPKIVAAA